MDIHTVATPHENRLARPEALCLAVPISGGEGDRVFRMDEVSESLLSARIGAPRNFSDGLELSVLKSANLQYQGRNEAALQ
jgi:hypothetical protein